MKLLLTNDDGIESLGLLIMAEELSKEHTVYVVAPDRNRSAVSHGITMGKPLELVKHDNLFQNDNITSYTCSGLPADCVSAGISYLFRDSMPDAVISGINKGANLGTDLIYSGTAAAARHAVLQYGVPGIATSLELVPQFAEAIKGEWNYLPLAQFVRRNISALLSLFSEDVFINVNAPSCNSFAGCRLAPLSQREYYDKVELYEAPNGKTYSFFLGGDVSTKNTSECDSWFVEKGFVAVSRVIAQPSSADYSSFANITFEMTD
ncbi:MAG: 5'/3'-nucleotidase SurE [Treponema sp.]|jgi:5'-nucleotidase|nr:5'/3'-nucleotidase SurE [Treponema sp.]